MHGKTTNIRYDINGNNKPRYSRTDLPLAVMQLHTRTKAPPIIIMLWQFYRGRYSCKSARHTSMLYGIYVQSVQKIPSS